MHAESSAVGRPTHPRDSGVTVRIVTDQLDQRPLTPPSSLEAAAAVDSTATSTGARHGDRGVLLSRHVTFLAGVLSLDSVSAAGGGQRCSTTHVVASTAQLVLDAVLRRLERRRRYHDDDDDDDDVISQCAAVHAVEVVARVCDVTDAAGVRDVVRQFVRRVVDNVINNDQLASQVLSLVVQVSFSVGLHYFDLLWICPTACCITTLPQAL